jgi:hypothetical protein
VAEELPRIYARESAAVVVFISADYAETVPLQTEVESHSTFDLGKLVMIKIMHGITVNVAPVDAADLVHEKPGQLPVDL